MNDRRSGYAMILVLALILVVSAVSATAFRYLATAARVERTISIQNDLDQGALLVAAQGLSLLETAPPPSNPYQCQTSATINGTPTAFELTYTSDMFNEWQLDVRPYSGSGLPTMPDSFANIAP
ncbi:MAG: hypothetical protein O3A00_17655 [Planctomycetota bacterium]|nr:hypothetical protein [Planctomycetota bacterium]